MEKGTFQEKVKKIVSQRNIFALAVIALSLAVFQMSLLLKNKEERIVVIPTVGNSFWIEKGRVSKEYLKEMGIFLSNLLLTRTPADVLWRNEQILSHVHPSRYTLLKNSLMEEKKEMLQKGSSFLFEIQKSYPREKNLQFILEGIQKIYIEKPGKGAPLVQSKKLRYILSFCCEQGRLFLINIQQEEIQ